MSYNLTDGQKGLLRWLVEEVRANHLQESFSISHLNGEDGLIGGGGIDQTRLFSELVPGHVEALRLAGLMYVSTREKKSGTIIVHYRDYALTGNSYKAVDSNYADPGASIAVSTLAHPHPPEISISLDRLRLKFPDPNKLGFLVMRFAATKPYERILSVIKKTAEESGVQIIRADENEFHSDLLRNVRTHLHGCNFGIALYERIEKEEPNANIGFEVGYLMAMNKPVLLLKDQSLSTLPADLAGKLYKDFDVHNPEDTIPAHIKKWLRDNGIVVSNAN